MGALSSHSFHECHTVLDLLVVWSNDSNREGQLFPFLYVLEKPGAVSNIDLNKVGMFPKYSKDMGLSIGRLSDSSFDLYVGQSFAKRRCSNNTDEGYVVVVEVVDEPSAWHLNEDAICLVRNR